MITLISLKGRPIKKRVDKYRVDWEKPCRSKIQFTAKQFFRPFWSSHVVFEEFPVFGTKMKIDILNLTKKIAVEVQGKQHNSFNKFFHGGRRYVYRMSLQRDSKKYEWLEKNGIALIEIFEEEIKDLTEEFIRERCGIELRPKVVNENN